MPSKENQPEQTEQPKKVPFGRLYLKGDPKTPMFEPLGTVSNDKTGKNKFGLALTEQGMNPVVISFDQDQVFILEWSDILRIAIEAGVDNFQLAATNDAPAGETPKLILPGDRH